jgi:hypothetical protein
MRRTGVTATGNGMAAAGRVSPALSARPARRALAAAFTALRRAGARAARATTGTAGQRAATARAKASLVRGSIRRPGAAATTAGTETATKKTARRGHRARTRIAITCIRVAGARAASATTDIVILRHHHRHIMTSHLRLARPEAAPILAIIRPLASPSTRARVAGAITCRRAGRKFITRETNQEWMIPDTRSFTLSASRIDCHPKVMRNTRI